MSVGTGRKYDVQRTRPDDLGLTPPPARPRRTAVFGIAVVAVAAAGAALSTAEPTRLAGADLVWNAALVATVAFFGATARRWTWFLPAGAGALLAGDGTAIVLAAAAIAIGFWSVLRGHRSRALSAVVTGLGVIALLRAEPTGFHGSTALATAAAVLPVVVSGYANEHPRTRRRVRLVALVVGTAVGLALVGVAVGTAGVVGDLTDGADAVDAGLRAARDADDEEAAAQLDIAAGHLSSADDTLSSWLVAPARVLPVVGPNIDAVESVSRQASEVAEVSSAAARVADVDALRFSQGRLDPAAVSHMIEPLRRVQRSLHGLQASIGDESSPWLVAPVADRIDELHGEVDDAVPDADNALLAVENVPGLLGADGDRRYLVLFTTQSEARGRFGFPGNFAELVVSDGRLSMSRFGRSGELEQGGLPIQERTLTTPPDYAARYGRFDVAATWRNLTMSPDLPSIAQAAAELYPQVGGQRIDGVLAIDPYGLAALMRYTGDVRVEGLDQPLTADGVATYLLRDQYLQFDGDTEGRIDVLEAVARTTFERLTSADLPGPRELSDDLDAVVDAGHIQFAPLDPEASAALTALGITGALPELEDGQDSVTVTTSNAGASKIDLYLQRTLDYRARWDPDTGEVTSTLRLQLVNTSPPDGLPDFVIGNGIGLPRGTNRSFVSIYSPYQMSAARVDGRPAALQSEVELDRNVYSTFVTIPPGGTVTVEVDLAGTLDGGRYELVLAPEGVVEVDQARVAVEVAGGADPVGNEADDMVIDGGAATWSGPMDRTRSLAVAPVP
jgi:Protein of unknown function (DUF4012)